MQLSIANYVFYVNPTTHLSMRIRSVACIFLATMGFFMAESGFADGVYSTKPVFVPNLSRGPAHLDESVLRWDAGMKSAKVPANSANAHFIFSFTNVSADNVVIASVRPSCGCTTAQLPRLPWIVPPGTNGQIGVTVNLAGKYGTVIKSVHIGTDHGSRDLIVQITILPSVIPVLTDADRIRQMAIAKADRQAVFKNDCAICHEKQGENKYGKALYDADCAICHEAKNRASMGPDLHHLTMPTGGNFWRTWIADGKPGTFMPAFSTAVGGPLSDMQIASLAAYLNSTIPSKVPPLE